MTSVPAAVSSATRRSQSAAASANMFLVANARAPMAMTLAVTMMAFLCFRILSIRFPFLDVIIGGVICATRKKAREGLLPFCLLLEGNDDFVECVGEACCRHLGAEDREGPDDCG